MISILSKIRRDLKEASDPKTKEVAQRFFKEPVKHYGVRTGVVVKIAKHHWKEAKNFSKKEIFELCEELYKSDYGEEAYVVATWIPNLADQFEEKDFKVFEHWVGSYINNWAKCDGFCNHSVGDFIEKFPKYIQELKRWATSKNIWLKRAAAVSLIIPAKQGKYLKDIFEIADILLLDPHDMVQKGYGWMLKEASRKHEKEVFDYVVHRKANMPRTALRYAIELMPKKLKVEAMKR